MGVCFGLRLEQGLDYLKKKKRNLASDPQESFKTVEDLVKLKPSVELKPGMVFSK